MHELWLEETPVVARVSQALSVLALAGSFVVPFLAGTGGSEQGREAFVAEVQTGYADTPGVRVSAQGTVMKIESAVDTDESLKVAADALRQQIRVSGSSAKAWLVGFTAIEMTNGSAVERITP
jgi:hypothetical protein